MIFCILGWFWDYPQQGTQGYRFGFSVVTSLLVVESITRYEILTYPLFIYFSFLGKMNLIPNQTISAATLFEVF